MPQGTTAIKSDPNENPWTDLQYAGEVGSNQVSTTGPQKAIKPHAVQQSSKLHFVSLPANFN